MCYGRHGIEDEWDVFIVVSMLRCRRSDELRPWGLSEMVLVFKLSTKCYNKNRAEKGFMGSKSK
jgi:hypothetical protein